MATVVQATEHVLVESATAVVTQITTAAAGEFKTVENSVAKEVVAAADDDPSSFVDKLEDGLQDVAAEVVKGAESAVEAVEAHPELIAEGALAVAIGAASLIQPELIAGEVALIGKMAADSAKKTVTQIASDTSSKVVKAISKDLADDAAEETAKDAAAAKVKADAEAGIKIPPGDASADAKAPTAVAGQDSAPGSTVAPSAPTEVGSKPLPSSTGTDAKASAEDNVSKVSTPSGDKTVSIQIATEASKTVTTNSSETKSVEAAAPPVSLTITIGADGEVKAVSKESNGDAKEVTKPTPAEADAIANAVSKGALESETGTAANDHVEGKEPTPSKSIENDPADKLESLHFASPTAESKIAGDNKPIEVISTKTSIIATDIPTAAENTSNSSSDIAGSVAAVGTKSVTKSEAGVEVLAEDKFVNEDVKVTVASSAKDTIVTKQDPDQAKNLLSGHEERNAVEKAEEKHEESAPSSSPAVAAIGDNILEASQSDQTENAQPVMIAAVASVATKTTSKTTTTTETAADAPMVTISQESLDHLHQKIDTMHVAIQEITKLLALHLPRLAEIPAQTTAPESGEAFSELQPLSKTAHTGDGSQQAQTSEGVESPDRPVNEKRTSLMGSIGKVLWPFGSAAPSDDPKPAQAGRSPTAPNLIKAPKATTSEVVTGGPEIII